MAPSLITRQYGSVMSTVVEPGPTTQTAVEHQIDSPIHGREQFYAAQSVGWPDKFALVAMSA